MRWRWPIYIKSPTTAALYAIPHTNKQQGLLYSRLNSLPWDFLCIGIPCYIHFFPSIPTCKSIHKAEAGRSYPPGFSPLTSFHLQSPSPFKDLNPHLFCASFWHWSYRPPRYLQAASCALFERNGPSPPPLAVSLPASLLFRGERVIPWVASSFPSQTLKSSGVIPSELAVPSLNGHPARPNRPIFPSLTHSSPILRWPGPKGHPQSKYIDLLFLILHFKWLQSHF